MKKFLKQFGLFTLLFVALNMMLYAIAYHVLNEASFEIDSKKVLVIGSSTTECAIDDDIFFETENVSQGGGTAYLYTYVKLKRFLEQNSHIEFVLLSIDSGTLMEDKWVYGGDYLDEKVPAYAYLFSKEEYKVLLYESSLYHGIARMPLTRIKAITRYISDGYITYKDLGIGTHRRLMGTYLNKAEINRHSVQIDESKISVPQLVYLRKIIDLCREQNVKLILITTPMYGTKPNEEFRDYLHKEFGDIDYLDYSAVPLPEFCYYDVDHLNDRGAVMFSRRIKFDFEQAYLRNRL